MYNNPCAGQIAQNKIGEISKWSQRGGLENRLSARARGFESHSLRYRLSR